VDAGIEVTHLDSHMGCCSATPELYAEAFKLVKKFCIPMISPFIPGRIEPEEEELFEVISYSGIYGMEDKKETLENRDAAYWKKFAKLPPGIHYFFYSPGIQTG
jgi:hypothetical protein